MMKKKFNLPTRRDFIYSSAFGVAGLSALSLLSSCSTFDDYLFEDRNEFSDEVIIIGGGIAGIYLASKLRANRTEFRLFEASGVFGGRIKSLNGVDYGASLLTNQDKLAHQLVKELLLTKKYVDSETFYIQEGMQEVCNRLIEQIIGLIPYRSFRLRWKLVEISKVSAGYRLVFENPSGQKEFVCKKVALAIPPSQWSKIKGLSSLPELHWLSKWMESINTENTIKFVLPANSSEDSSTFLNKQIDDLFVRKILKRNVAGSGHYEVGIKYLSSRAITIDYIYDFMRKRLKFSADFQRLTPEQFYDWRQTPYIGGSVFTNFLAIPEQASQNFQLVGDSVGAESLYSIEGALQSAQRASLAFL